MALSQPHAGAQRNLVELGLTVDRQVGALGQAIGAIIHGSHHARSPTGYPKIIG